MELLPMMSWLWFVHTITAGAISLPLIYFGRKRAQWEWWELFAFLLPFSIWAVWMVVDGTGKSLANLGDCMIISYAIPVAALLRVLFGHRKQQWIISGILLLLLCGVAVGAYLLTPPLPEG